MNMFAISVIVPCYNEESTIQLLLEAIDQQTFPHEQFEVIFADGLSTDQTRQVIEIYRSTHKTLQIKLVENQRRNIPSGLNCAIKASSGRYIIRLDGHSIPHSDYLEKCFQDLEAKRGDNVGGIWDIQAGFKGKAKPSWISRGIAAATAHPFGVGDAHYRFTDKAQYVDTVPFGAFQRQLVDKIGYFDETLLTNEDYEFNVRIRRSGGKIWLNPSIHSVYFARSTLISLIKQYWRYGYWKGQMLLRYPDTLRWRQFLPPLFVVCLTGLSILTIINKWFGLLLLIQIGLYSLVLLVVGIQTGLMKKDLFLFISTPLAIASMHLTWGSGVLWSLLTSLLNKGFKLHAP